MAATGKIITCNGWMYDEKEFPPKQCIYVVALNKEAISAALTEQELSKFKYYIFISSTHFFKEFTMPKFDVLFIKGWQTDSKSRVIDYDIVNFAIKHSMKLIQYDGEHGDLLDAGSTNKELVFHGILNDEKPMSNIVWHPEVLQNQADYLKGHE